MKRIRWVDPRPVSGIVDQERGRVLSAYGTAPSLGRWLPRPTDAPAIGWELETHTGLANHARVATTLLSHCPWLAAVSRDSSVSGVELRTYALSMPAWLARAREIETALRYLDARGHRSWDGAAGLHVSVSRDGLGRVGLHRLLAEVHGHANWWAQLAGRRSDYAEYVADWASYYGPICRNGMIDGWHRAAVNLAHTSHIELRIWRGSLRVQTLMGALAHTWLLRVWAEEGGAIGYRDWLSSCARYRYPAVVAAAVALCERREVAPCA